MTPRKALPKQPNEPLREAFLQSGLTLADLCRRMDWIDRRGNADTTRLSRALGMKPYTTSRKPGKTYPGAVSDFTSHDNAVKILEGLSLAPVDVGL